MLVSTIVSTRLHSTCSGSTHLLPTSSCTLAEWLLSDTNALLWRNEWRHRRTYGCPRLHGDLSVSPCLQSDYDCGLRSSGSNYKFFCKKLLLFIFNLNRSKPLTLVCNVLNYSILVFQALLFLLLYENIDC